MTAALAGARSATGAGGGDISGGLVQDPAPAVNLTAAGATDWAVWGYGANGTSTSLAPDVGKAGGSGISDLTNIDPAPSVPLRGLGQTFPGQSPHPFLFDWSNGDTTPSASGATAGLQHNGGPPTNASTLGHGFSFSVPAGPATQILRVYVATNRADGALTAHLSDGSAPDYTSTLPQALDQRSGVYTISYRAASPNQTLTVTWVESADGCAAFRCDNAAIFAAALSPGYVVNTTADTSDGTCDLSNCTLREAIAAANADGVPSAIGFDMADPGPITLTSALPTISAPVTIDGFTQPGSEANLSTNGSDHSTHVVELHAPPACNCTAALQVDQGGSGSTIRGLAINGGVSYGIFLNAATNVTIAGDFIGLTAAGTPTPPTEKLSSGVYVGGGGGNTIGGPNPADHNVIGNTSTIILVTGIDLDGTVANTIENNAVGVGIDGTSAVPNADGIALFNGASNNTISSNVISGNAYYGITIADATTSSNTIVANLIGTIAGGTDVLANGSGGILVSGGKSNVIGTTPVGVNIISGNLGDGVHIVGGNGTSLLGNILGLRADGGGILPNTGAGIYVSGSATVGTTIRGNVASGNAGIGISIDGSQAAGGAPTGTVIAGNRAGINAGPVGNTDYGNGGDGIRLWQVTSTLVGGTSAADRNVASGNVGHGIHVLGGGNNTIQGNYAGTNLAGAGAIKNDIDGIAIDESSNNLVGGTAAGAGNVASGNQNQGISVFTFSGSGAAASGNRVFGNTAGLAADGSTALPNGGEGIRVYGGANNQIGGVDTGQANEVARNVGAGITVYLATATGNSIRGNEVHDNGAVGIGLSADGVTVGVVPNDAGDGDVGGNNLQNFPVLTDVVADGKSVTVAGTLDTNAGVVNIDYYANTACDGSGNGEGATYLGTTQLTTGQGATPFNDVLTSPAAAAVVAGQFITATATDKNGNTSGYSACFASTGNAAGLTLTATEASVPAGAANVPLSSVPAATLGQFAFSPVPNSPVPNSGVGAAPVPNSPVPNSPVPNSPVPNSPVANSPVPNSGFDGIALANLDQIPLSSIPIDWSRIFVAPDVHANVPPAALTLKDVVQDQAAYTLFKTLNLGDLQLQGSLLRGTRFVSYLYGATRLQYIPPYTQSAWCALLSSCTDVQVTRTTVLGLDVAGLLNDNVIASLGKVTVGQVTDPGPPVTPIPNSPVPNSPVPNSPVPNSPVPNSAFTLTSIGGVVIGDLYNPAAVVDCTKFTSQTVCLTKTLADAAALNAIKPGITFANLLTPKNPNDPATASPLANINFNAFSMATIGIENLPWESWPIDGFQQFAPTGDVVHYELTASVPCGTAYTLKATLPRGFVVKAGTSTFAVGRAPLAAVGDPTQDATGATWSTTGQKLPLATGCVGTGKQSIRLDFQGLAGFRIGEQTGVAKLTVGTTTTTATGQAPVTVTQNLEPDGSAATAPAIQPNVLAVGHIASGSDLDWRTFSTAGLAPGTKVVVYMRPPAGTDLDVYLEKPQAQSLLSSPVPNSPVPNSPVPNSPLPDNGDTLNRTTDNPQPEGLQDAPVPNSDIAAAGITRGDGVEVAQVTLSGDENGPVRILVAGYNGDHSNDPYTLRVKVIAPRQLPACPARSFPNASATAGSLPASIPADTKTLLLVNQTAMGRTYGQTAADTLMTRLRKFSTDHPDLKAVVVPVDGDGAVATATAAWDAAPCSIAAANDVVRKINALVARLRAQASGIEYLTIVGTDEQIPMARVVDKTTDANESTASGDLAFTTNGLTRANALFASEFLGYTLTDDAYAAGDLVPWFGNELYLPQFAVGRLVETPDDISRQLDRFDASGGMLNPSTGVVAGYDFMRDLAKLVRSNLVSSTNAGRPLVLDPAGSAGNPFILASDSILDPDLWTQGDVSPYFANPAFAGRGILNLNGHYNHWELAASAPTPIQVPTLVPTSVLPTGPNAGQLANAILFTMGCHAGLNVSDSLGASAADTQKLRDWAQAIAQNGGGVYVANTGYGYGDYGSVALSERLMSMFAQNLATDGSIGKKLVLAKQRYFASISSSDPYTEKALVEATFYGLPFYRLGTGPDTLPGGVVTPTGSGNVQSVAINQSFTFDRHDDAARGTFWSIGPDGVEYLNGRPIEPRKSFDVTPTTGGPAHGVWIDALTTHDITGINPQIATPMIDASAHEPELKVSNATFPATFVSLNHWKAFGTRHDELVVVPGQTREGVTQRLIDSINTHVLYSTSADTAAPLFGQVGSVVNGGTVTLFAHVSDAAGISRVAAYFTQGGANWTFVDLVQQGTSDLYVGTASGITVSKIEAAFEAQDANGNVGHTTDKGFLFTSKDGDANGPQVTIFAPIDNGVFTPNQVVPAAFECFDDGGVKSCTGTVANGQNIDTSTLGPHTFTVTATDLGNNTVVVKATYFVRWPFSGFFQPVDNPPVLNQANAGQAIPVKFSLKGNRGLNIFAPGSPSSQPITCDVTAPIDVVDQTVTASSSGLSYDAGADQYTYVWKTDKSFAGSCRQLTLLLADGTSHSALFKFK